MSEMTTIAIVSASSALAGVLLSSLTSWLLSEREQQRARQQLSREKLEEVSLLLVDSLKWIVNATSAKSLEELSAAQQCPEVHEAASISLLYFPELYKPITAYSNDIVLMHNYLVGVYDPLMGGTVGSHAARNEYFENNVDELRKKRQAVLDVIKEIAPKYTKA